MMGEPGWVGGHQKINMALFEHDIRGEKYVKVVVAPVAPMNPPMTFFLRCGGGRGVATLRAPWIQH